MKSKKKKSAKISTALLIIMFPNIPLTSGLRKLLQPVTVPLLPSSLVRSYRHLCLLLTGGEFNLSLTNTSSGKKKVLFLKFHVC